MPEARDHREAGRSMTAGLSNLERLQHWYGTYAGRGLMPAEDLIDELFDPEVVFSPWVAREIEQRTFHGPDGIRAFFAELAETLGEVRYARPEFRPLSDNLIVVLTRLEGSGRASLIPVGQYLGLVFEFSGGMVTRMTAFGSHREALEAAEETQRA